MNFKNTLLLSAVGFFAFTAHAQIQHQIGANASQFVKQFITPNNAGLSNNNPYLVTYRLLTPKINYRLGLGGTSTFLNEDNGPGQFQRNTDNSAINARIGVDFKKEITKHWFIYYGVDLTLARSKNVVTTTPKGGQFISKTVVTRSSKANGAAACLTFEYRLNDKITMFTEANLNYSRGRSLEKVDNPDFPNSSTESTTRSGNFIFNAPISLFFSIIL